MPKSRKSSNTHRPANSTVESADAVPEPRSWWLIALVGVATLSLAYPVFSGAFLVNPHSDQYIAGYGFRSFAAQSLRAGEGFPQWNPYMFGGLPYVAAMHGDIFYPTFLLRLVMPTDLAMTLGFIIHTFLCGAFTVGFLRSTGLGRWPALFGAMAYLLCGPIASYASPGHDGKLFVSALLPLGLWMLTRAIARNESWAWGMFALTVGLAVLSPHPAMLQYFLLVCGAYALVFAWRRSAHDKPQSTRNDRSANASGGPGGLPDSEPLPQQSPVVVMASRLAVAAAMVVIGFGIGAIQYWPVLGYVNSSPRANGREYEFATSFSFPPEELINTYLPQFSGLLDQYWGRNQIHLHSEYLGVVVLMLAPLAFGVGSRRLLARFWLATGIVALLWALGGFTPFFRLIYAYVPGTQYFRAPSTIIFVVAFAVCVLGALGFERVLKRAVPARFLTGYLAGWAAFGVLVGLLAWSGLLLQFAHKLGQGFARQFGHDPEGFRQFMNSNSEPLSVGAARSLIVVVAAAALIYAYNRRKIKSGAFALAVVVVSSIDLWSIGRRYWMFSEPASVLFRADPIMTYLQNQTQPGRVFVYSRTADYRAVSDPYFGSRGMGEGAGLMSLGIRSVTGYQGNVLARYEALTAGQALVNPSFWFHENVRWLYTNQEIADTLLKRIDGPITNSAGSTTYLYEMPGNNPYAWVAASYGAQSDSSALRDILNGDPDPRAFVAVDTSTRLGGKVVPPKPAIFPEASTITATTTNFGPGRATIAMSEPASAGSALVISENYYKGWRAIADGKDLPVVRAAFNLVGVPLPQGTRQVTFTFKDERYETGKLITLVSLLVGLALLVPGALGWVRDRQRLY